MNNSNENISISSFDFLNALNIYTPLILTTGLLFASIYTGSLLKGIFYIFLIIIITLISYMNNFFQSYQIKENTSKIITKMINVCSSYNIFILSFTLFYLLMPMLLVSSSIQKNIINLNLILIVVAYLIYNILIIKIKNLCNEPSIKSIILNIFTGSILGIIISITLFYSFKSLLFINELFVKEIKEENENEIYKCNIYNNGVLIGTTTSKNNIE